MGGSWTTTGVVSTESTGLSSFPSLAVDLSGNIHVAWEDWTNYGGIGNDHDIFYKRYEVGSGWTTTEVVSTVSTEVSTSIFAVPSVAIDPSENVHIAWSDGIDHGGSGTDWDIFYKRYVVGVGWTATEVVSTESTDESIQPSLTVDSSGDVHIAWEDYTDYSGAGSGADIFYKRYGVDSGWTTTEVVTSDMHGFHPSLAVDLSGNIHVAFEVWSSGIDYDIFYKRYVVGVGWTATEVVSTESTDLALDPSLAVDLGGNIHVAWEDTTDYGGSGTDMDIFYKLFWSSVSAEPLSLRDILEFPGAIHLTDIGEDTHPLNWVRLTGNSVVSTESVGDSTWSSLAVGLDGNVHIAWQDLTDYDGCGTDQDIFYKRYEFGVGWTATEVVSTESTSYSYDPSLAVDSAGNVHIAWRDGTDYGGSGSDSDIFYRRYEVGFGWTTTEVVSTESTGHSYEPSLAFDAAGNVHIAWFDLTDYSGSGTDTDVFYKRYEVGSGWTTTEVVTRESTNDSFSPSLAVDSAGNVHIAWQDSTNYDGAGGDPDIFYKRYEVGPGWTVAEVVSTESTGDSDKPSLAVDSTGDVHVAWHDWTDYGGSGIDVDIFYKRYELGSGWTTTQLVSTESTGGSYVPSLAVDHKGNLHVAWSDETDYGGSGTDWDAFYKRNEVGSGWTTTEVIVDFTGDAYHVSLAVDSGGNVNLAWEDSTAIYGADWDIFYKRYETAKYAALTDVMTGVDGFQEVMGLLIGKGFTFNPAASNISTVNGGLNGMLFSGTVLSLWSDPDPNNIYALLVAALMDDGHSMVFGACTNILPAELVSSDSYMIVNAMPYSFIRWFYYDTLNSHIVDWSYSWFESNSPPNWFWGIYWKWSNYIDEYYGWHTYLPWWWWFWHYTYDKHWHNLGAEFPY